MNSRSCKVSTRKKQVRNHNHLHVSNVGFCVLYAETQRLKAFSTPVQTVLEVVEATVWPPGPEGKNYHKNCLLVRLVRMSVSGQAPRLRYYHKKNQRSKMRSSRIRIHHPITQIHRRISSNVNTVLPGHGVVAKEMEYKEHWGSGRMD